jgi:hypothetical protein
MLGSVFGPKREEVIGSGESYTTKSRMICTPHPVFFGWSNQEYEMGG